MAMIENILKAVGKTPLVRLNKIVPEGAAEVWAKAEFLNPAGSVKERMALYIIEKAEREGVLKPGGTIIEGSSGNTGLGIAMVAALKGYKAVITISDKMSSEKVNQLKAFGARVVICPANVPAESPHSYYETARRLVRETPGAFYLNQYHNPENIEAHYLWTGPEIWEETGGQFDSFVAGIGTGGTLSGIGRFIKEKNPNIKVIAVDPAGSVFYSYFKTGKLPAPHAYKVEGIGEDMLVEAMDFSVVDDLVQVTDRDCFLTARRLTREYGSLLVIDEVITGFRWSPGGCQALVGVTPDLSSLGKMVSGGLPGAAVCGRAEVMDLLQIRAGDPEWNRYRHVVHPGTWNANPLCAVAGITTLRIAATGEPQKTAEAMAKRLVAGLNRQIEKRGIEACAYNTSSAIHLYVGPCQKCDRQICLDASKRMPSERILALDRHLLLNGVNLLRGTIGWVSAVHSEQDIDETVDAFGIVLDGLVEEGMAKAA